MTTAVREAIHERLDPIIEEIVTREISQRGGYPRGREVPSFEAILPLLLPILTRNRQMLFPMLLSSALGRRQKTGQERSLEILALLLTAALSAR